MVTQYAGDEFGIVPVFFVELLGQSLDGYLIAALVLELEVVTLVAVFVNVLDDVSC